ncbi:hypothetical protein [Streptosporangium sp. 'caverna']|uniref:hypothetical protein n=1 Tax=Streptosporangium sp. 'caverna' TaxID=2202249 RepID=UPI001EF76F75|nr:hypothetical protein [Streptosporangium sp. 'caverna']
MTVPAVGRAVTSVDPTVGGVVAELVRVRRLTDQEGQKLQQIVRRVPVIAKLVQADEDTVRDVIHQFNEIRTRPHPQREGNPLGRTPSVAA